MAGGDMLLENYPNDYNNARKGARLRRKNIKLDTKSNGHRTKESKFRVVVMDPAMNVKDL